MDEPIAVPLASISSHTLLISGTKTRSNSVSCRTIAMIETMAQLRIGEPLM